MHFTTHDRIYNIWDGHNNANEFPDVSTTRTRLREAQLCYGKGVEEVVDQRRKLVTFEERAVAAGTSFARL